MAYSFYAEDVDYLTVLATCDFVFFGGDNGRFIVWLLRNAEVNEKLSIDAITIIAVDELGSNVIVVMTS